MRFRALARGVRRPEGVAVGPDGTMWASDSGSAVMRFAADDAPPVPVGRAGGEPNGINFAPTGELWIADFQGGLLALDTHTGTVGSTVSDVDGRSLVHTNFVLADAAGFVWATESYRTGGLEAADIERMTTDPDGWMFVRRPDGSTGIVADRLAFANGLCLSPDGRWLYVAETVTGAVSRARILRGGALAELETVHVFGADGLEPTHMGLPGPDGLGFDAAGDLWITLWNRRSIAVVHPDGSCSMVTDDLIDMPTNVAWAGPDRRLLLIGSVKQPFVAAAHVDTPGAPPPYEIVTPAGSG